MMLYLNLQYKLYFIALNRSEMRHRNGWNHWYIIVDNLFSMFITLRNVPIIRCPKGNAAEMMLKKLMKNWKRMSGIRVIHYSKVKELIVLGNNNTL